MSGYLWAETPEGAQFVVLAIGEKGYVPGVENAIDLADFNILGPVAWHTETTPQNRSSRPTKRGALAQDAMPECRILPFVANG